MEPIFDMFMMEEMLMMFLPVLTSAIPSSVLGIASYVLTALALYSAASRRGIRNAWLSWVPVLNVWIIGSLSDQYRYVVKGQYKSKRKWLLILKLLGAVLACAIAVIALVMAVEVTGNVMFGSRNMDMLFGPVLAICALALPLMGVGIAALVIRYMAMYDIYMSMDPGNSVMFLVLSIFFHVTEPFFLFFNRNKDGGMPPRRQESVYEAPQQPQWQPPEPEQEVWQENKDYL